MKRIIEWLRIFIYSLKREFMCILNSRLFLTLLIILPLLLFTFFSYFYSHGTINDIAVGICDADNSELSRSITRCIESSKTIRIVAYINDIENIEYGLQGEKYNGVFYFPRDFEKKIKKQHRANVVFFKNSQNILLSNMLYKEASQIFKSYNAGIVLKKLKMSNLSEKQAVSIVQPIVTDIHYIGNANFNYGNFLSPAYVYVCCQIILMLAGMFSITHEIDDKRYNRVIQSAFKYTGALLLGKCITILSVSGTILFITQCIIFPLFKININCPALLLFGLTLIYFTSSLLPGMAIGALVKESFLATEVIIFINMPSLLVSGYTFPAVPKILEHISQVLPFIHFMNMFFKIGQLNGALHYVYNELLSLSLIIVISFFASWFLFFTMNKQIETNGL